MKTLLLFVTLFIGVLSFGQYADTISCNGGTLEFVVDYDQQTCDATCNGNYTVTILNGVGPYNYTVTGPSYSNNTASDINLCPGSYSVTVDDVGQGINCSHNFNILALTPNNYTTNVIMPTSYGACDGVAEIIVTGGVPPYSYQWYDASMTPIPGGTTYQLTGLCAGTYFVEFEDATPPCGSGTGGVGASGSGIIMIVIYDPVVVTITNSWEAVCPGTCTAWIEYTVSGGSGVYNDPNGGWWPECDGGSGTITICDDQGNCGTSMPYWLLGWPGVDISTSGTDETCPGACDGSIDFIDNWGALGYSIDGISYQPTSTFNGLCAGYYDQLWAEIPDAGYGGTCFVEIFPDITLSSGGGTDTDGDGTCDLADLDDDNDGVPDTQDIAPLDPQMCQDLDGDGCDDCSMNPTSAASPTPWMIYAPDTFNDGIDGDGDGMCDSGDPCPFDFINDADGDGYCASDECDDNDPNAYPGQIWYPDCDGDGYFSSVGIISCLEPASPCNDGMAPDGGWSHSPGNDCDDEDPSATLTMTYYQDSDGDGYGDPSTALTSCVNPGGYVTNGSDCDDSDFSINPGVPESPCDGYDNDCNLATPDNVDNDGDGVSICMGDCDDNDPNNFPGNIEVCDGQDNNCDGLVDADDPTLVGGITYYLDSDGDGYGDPTISIIDCNQPANYVLDNTDCDDTDGTVNPSDADGDGISSCNGDCDDNDPNNFPGNTEICDGQDNNCDGLVDGDDPTLVGGITFYMDNDGDGYGDFNNSIIDCSAPPGYVANSYDCDDWDGNVGPTMPEIECNGIDDDCNPSTPDDWTAPVADTATLTNITAVCSYTPATPTATDNCSGTINGSPDVTFPITSQGVTTITWTYDDGQGNSSSQTQDVTILPVDTYTYLGTDFITMYAGNSNATYQWIDCTNGNTIIPGATGQSYTATVNGDYAVIVTENGCADTSDCMTISVIGLEELELFEVSIYPNPSTGVFTVTIPSIEEGAELEIVDAQGRMVMTRSIDEKDTQIDVHHVEDGTYYLKVIMTDVYRIIPIVINK